MPFAEAKIYFDGSHYIAIPHTVRPSTARKKLIEDTFVSLATLEDRVKFNDGTKIVSFKDLVADGTILVDTTKNSGYYTYTMTIPEPSTYAMIFGAIALGFVAYRRRK